MAFMCWSEALSVGIPKIDEQHRWLVDAINRLHDELLVHAEPDPAMLKEILEGLVDYAVNHFVMEEEMFQRYGYPEAAEHKAEHDGFTQTAVALLQSVEAGKTLLGADVLNMLKSWLTGHIMGTDMAYVPFFKALKA